jgi:hypothetical protein
MKNKDENANKKPTNPGFENKPNKKSDAQQRKLSSGYPVLGENAEDYLREDANIEDLPIKMIKPPALKKSPAQKKERFK